MSVSHLCGDWRVEWPGSCTRLLSDHQLFTLYPTNFTPLVFQPPTGRSPIQMSVLESGNDPLAGKVKFSLNHSWSYKKLLVNVQHTWTPFLLLYFTDYLDHHRRKSTILNMNPLSDWLSKSRLKRMKKTKMYCLRCKSKFMITCALNLRCRIILQACQIIQIWSILFRMEGARDWRCATFAT